MKEKINKVVNTKVMVICKKLMNGPFYKSINNY